MRKISNGLLNVKGNIIPAIICAICLFSCDTLEDELGRSEFAATESYRKTLPGGSILFDLKSTINVNENIEADINAYPERGSVSFLEDGFLLYEPSIQFSNGTDRFSLLLQSESGEQLNSSFEIEMISDSTGLPCFGGAIGESYILGKNEAIQFNPFLNDGICPENASSYSVTLEDPVFGSATEISDGVGILNLYYKPPVDFVGKDSLFYHVELTDPAGVVHNSSALIKFSMLESGDCDLAFLTNTIWADQEIIYPTPYEPEYLIPFSGPPVDCGFPEYAVSILEATGGSATYDVATQSIKYIPSVDVGSNESIEIEINIGNSIYIKSTISLIFN